MRTRRKPMKWISYGLFYILVLVLQTSFFYWLPILGGTPVMPACYAAALGAYEGPKSGAAFGLVCGILADALIGSVGFFTLMCTLVGFAAGGLTENVLRRNWGIAFLLSLAALVATELLRVIYYLFFNSLSSSLIWHALLPGYLYSAILAVPMLLVISLIHKRFAFRY